MQHCRQKPFLYWKPTKKSSMSKVQTRFVCQNCGRTSPRAMGRCPQCGGWGTMVEEVIAQEGAVPARAVGQGGLSGHSRPRRLAEIEGDEEDRLSLSIGEFARVLGGGVVPGSCDRRLWGAHRCWACWQWRASRQGAPARGSCWVGRRCAPTALCCSARASTA